MIQSIIQYFNTTNLLITGVTLWVLLVIAHAYYVRKVSVTLKISTATAKLMTAVGNKAVIEYAQIEKQNDLLHRIIVDICTEDDENSVAGKIATLKASMLADALVADLMTQEEIQAFMDDRSTFLTINKSLQRLLRSDISYLGDKSKNPHDTFIETVTEYNKLITDGAPMISEEVKTIEKSASELQHLDPDFKIEDAMDVDNELMTDKTVPKYHSYWDDIAVHNPTV